MKLMRTEGFDVLHAAEQLARNSGLKAVGTVGLLVAAMRVDPACVDALVVAGVDPRDVEATARDIGLGAETPPPPSPPAAAYGGLTRVFVRPLPMTAQARACIEAVGVETDGEAGVEHIVLALLHGSGVAADTITRYESARGAAEEALRALAAERNARANEKSPRRRRRLFSKR